MPINSTLDVVVQQDDLIVLGPPNTIDVSVDIGPAGDRGSLIFSGGEDPNGLTISQFTSTYGESPNYRDMFLRTEPGVNYGTFYSYTSIPGGDQWNSVLNIIDVVELFFDLNTDFILSASAGGTGVDNGLNTLTFTGDISFAGNNDVTFNTSGVTNITLPMSGSVAVWQDKLSKFASTTSSELAGVISDETGTGLLVFNTNPNILSSLTTSSTTFNLLNASATTINFGGAATDIQIGSPTGTTNVNNNLEITGTTTFDNDLLTNDTTINIFNTNATSINFGGNATTIEIGSATGTTNINHNLTVDGTITGNLTGNVTGNASTASTLQTARTISLSGDVAGSVSFNGSSDVNITTTVQPNSIVLATDTTGDYVATVVGSGDGINVTGTGEGASVTISNTGVTSLIGTTNQVGVSASTGSITLSLPNDVNIVNDLTVGGNFTVSGSATYVNTTQLYVEDNIIILNSGVSASPTLDAAIEIERGTSPNVSIFWNESSDRWQFTNDGTIYKDLGSGISEEVFASQFLMMGA